MFEDSLGTFVGILPNISAFFELKLENSFHISDSLVSLKFNLHSNDTFSLVVLIRRLLYLLIAISTSSSYLELKVISKFSYSFIPSSISVFSK